MFFKIIGAPFVRTKTRSLEKAFDTLQHHTSFHGKTFVDLGIINIIIKITLLNIDAFIN